MDLSIGLSTLNGNEIAARPLFQNNPEDQRAK
jgi:hypothetical protein